MAEPTSVVDKALKKLADQLECSICLNYFNDPKLLQCFHVFCKKCLEPLVLRDQREPSLCCPKCRRFTLIPASGVSGFDPAFHIHHLFEIQDALRKVKQGQEGQKTQCEKCKKQEATNFCRTCGKFICLHCKGVHDNWEEFSTHKVISFEQLKTDATEMVPPKNKMVYCSRHPGKELDLFCETDHELICRDCIVKTHRDHQYDLVTESFPKYQDVITSHLEPVKQQLSTVNKAIQDLESNKDEIVAQQAAIEDAVQRRIRQLHEALEMRKTELIVQLDQMTQQKLKTLSIQRDELELIQTRLNSCLQYVSDSLKTGSKGEILAMEKQVVLQIENMCAEFDPNKLPPQEQAGMSLIVGKKLLLACQQFGQVYSGQVCPEKCYVTEKAPEAAIVDEQSTVTVHAINKHGSRHVRPLPDTSISCELVSCSTAKSARGLVKPAKSGEYKISYQPTVRGRNQLHIKVSDQHIKGSPLTVIASRKLGAPVRTITGLIGPWGITTNRRGQVIIANYNGHCISIYGTNGEVKSFGKRGLAPGQFEAPLGIAVDIDGNLLIADGENHCIHKFTGIGKYVAFVGSKGDGPGQFSSPTGIGISSSGKVYVCDRDNHRIQILNPDLTFSSSFGSEGSGDGQFNHPWDVAFDSHGNVYVADNHNHCVQVFTEDGHFLRKFGRKGGGDGELNCPVSVAIDSDHVVYVADNCNYCVSLYTGEGHFLRSFGARGNGSGQFNGPLGISVDRDGLLYVTEYGNNRLQVF